MTPSPARVLMVHQNYPGQYLHLAPALRDRGHQLVALGAAGARATAGIPLRRYDPSPAGGIPPCHPWLADTQAKVIRGEAVGLVVRQLLDEGFAPDLVIGHPGWGELLALPDLLPGVPVLHQQEFVYRTEGADYGFDPAVDPPDWAGGTRVRLRRSLQLHALDTFRCGVTPTWFQWSSVPGPYRDRVQVIHEGVDTERITPQAPEGESDELRLANRGLVIGQGEELVTFVNRNLEPMRGFHTFLRMLPLLQELRPKARVVVIGGDGISYGNPPPGGGSWRTWLLRELEGRIALDRVHFVGRVPPRVLHAVFRLSRCHVYLTVPFVLGWSMLEAMACGAVVVGSRTPPVQEVLDHGVNGLLVDFFDHEALARQVAEVLAEPARFQPLAEAARRTVVDRYDLRSRSLPALLALVDQLLAGSGPVPMEPPASLAPLLLPG
ncbi:MAG: glycosyltransferase [Prochlorococcaceae cyanobacterium]